MHWLILAARKMYHARGLIPSLLPVPTILGNTPFKYGIKSPLQPRSFLESSLSFCVRSFFRVELGLLLEESHG